MIEITKFEGLLWDLPSGSCEFGSNYEVPIEIISKSNLSKLTNIQASKPENLVVIPEKMSQQQKLVWDMIPESKNAVAHYVVEYKQPSSDKPYKQQISGLDTSCPLLNLKPQTVYFLRIMAVDFSKNMFQSDFIEFTSSKQAPEPPKVLLIDPVENYLSWEQVDFNTESFEVSYCKTEGAESVVVEKLGGEVRKLVLDDLEKNTEYLASIRAENEFGFGSAKFLKFKL